jgi:hypothetical protein
MKQRKPLLAPLINVGIEKIEEFVFKSRDCKLYALAMSEQLISSFLHHFG